MGRRRALPARRWATATGLSYTIQGNALLKHRHFVSDFTFYVSIKHRKLTECVVIADVNPVAAKPNPAVYSLDRFDTRHRAMDWLQRKL
jgi:hypothetical protein